MPGAVRSALDASILNAMRARRHFTERQAEEKLRVLRRLRRRHQTGSLPKESQAEGSFVEQLFAKLFDYATLLSQDADPYHLYVKPHVTGNRRFPDFALGVYAPEGEMFLASAELKGSEADLDAPQTGNYGGLSPVQQAFKAVRGISECRWVIISNLLELRLYRRIDLTQDDAIPPGPIAVASLVDVWDQNDLARLCAHFDRAALVGRSKDMSGRPRSELMAALEQRHPATPVDAEKDRIRAVILFTPRIEEDLPMFLIERRLRDAIATSPRRERFFESSVGGGHFQLAEGCIIASAHGVQDGPRCKVAMSGEGQIQMSVSQKLDAKGVLPLSWVVDFVRFFFEIIDHVFDGLNETMRPGRVSPELREVQGVTLKVDPALAESGMPAEGQAANDVMGVDFLYTPVFQDAEQLMTDVVSELAIYFRSASGGGVAVDRDKLRDYQSGQVTSSSAPPKV